MSIPPRKEGDETAAEKPAEEQKPVEQKPVRDPAAEAAALAAMEAELSGETPAPGFTPKAPEPAKAKEPEPKAEKPAPEKKAPEKKTAPAKVKAEDDPNKIPPAPPWYRTLRTDPPAYMRMALAFGAIFVLLFVWWFLTHGADPTQRIVSPSKLPSPGEVFGSFGAMMKSNFVESLVDSLVRVFKGILLAAIVGITLGVLSASHRGVASALEPIVIFLRSVPMGALIPLTLLLFGDGEKQKSMFIFLAVVPFVFSDSVKAVSIVPERYVETAQTLGASRFQIITKVLVPLALPDIITSLRFQLGLALGYIMLVEVVNTEHGLGTMLNTSQRLGMSEQIYLLLFVIAFIAFTLDYLLRTLQRGIFAWRRDL